MAERNKKPGGRAGRAYGFTGMRTPLQIGPLRKDVTPEYSLPPKTDYRDPLGLLPPETGGKKRR